MALKIEHALKRRRTDRTLERAPSYESLFVASSNIWAHPCSRCKRVGLRAPCLRCLSLLETRPGTVTTSESHGCAAGIVAGLSNKEIENTIPQRSYKSNDDRNAATDDLTEGIKRTERSQHSGDETHEGSEKANRKELGSECPVSR